MFSEVITGRLSLISFISPYYSLSPRSKGQTMGPFATEPAGRLKTPTLGLWPSSDIVEYVHYCHVQDNRLPEYWRGMGGWEDSLCFAYEEDWTLTCIDWSQFQLFCKLRLVSWCENCSLTITEHFWSSSEQSFLDPSIFIVFATFQIRLFLSE